MDGAPISEPGPSPAQARGSRGRLADWGRAAAPILALALLATLFRLQPLLNPYEFNSDTAVVGLQARHILAGEWSWHLWGIGYQNFVEPLFTALGFWLVESTPRVMMVVSFVGFVVALAALYSLLARYTSAPLAFVALLPLALGNSQINGVAMWPPRQWSLTALVSCFWLLDRAVRRRFIGLAAGLGTFALSIDFFTVLFLPGLLVAFVARGYSDWPRWASALSAPSSSSPSLSSSNLGWRSFDRRAGLAMAVGAACGDYWLAYRLSLLFEEAPTVMPLGVAEDRYPPYRQRFASARRVAYIFAREGARSADVQSVELSAAGQAIERFDLGGYVVLVTGQGGMP